MQRKDGQHRDDHADMQAAHAHRAFDLLLKVETRHCWAVTGQCAEPLGHRNDSLNASATVNPSLSRTTFHVKTACCHREASPAGSCHMSVWPPGKSDSSVRTPTTVLGLASRAKVPVSNCARSGNICFQKRSLTTTGFVGELTSASVTGDLQAA